MPATPLAPSICDIVLRDGSTLAVRGVTPADVPGLVAFARALSALSRYHRFGAVNPDASWAARLVPDDGSANVALVGECGNRIVAFAGYCVSPIQPDRAEVAFAIADALQGRGVATRLLERLADLARARGVRTFDAYVLADNRRMIEVFRESGFNFRSELEPGLVHVELSLTSTPAFRERAAQRSQAAAAASIRPFFEPRTVAVIGANRERGKIGAEILHNLQASGFTGSICPVHPTAERVQGLRSFRRVLDIPEAVDLAIIAVPAAQVLDVVDDCLAKGVRALCVISAGFGETGAEGRQRERTLLERVRAAGARLVGPNCMGLLNTDPAVGLNGTFSPVYPPAGSVAMSTQSGALGLAILDYARRLNIGISSFVSVGNKIDVSGNDLIQYWADDPRTDVILLYLESFGNPKKFADIARRVARRKPIVAVKAGRSDVGARAASSHTGAMATSDTVVNALFRQAGVIRTHTLEELFDVAMLLAHQPVPRGRRVAILTNAGGPGILAADACDANGLTVATLGERTRAALRQFLPGAAAVANPVDMLAAAPPEHYRRALTVLLDDDAIDSVMTIFIPPLVTNPEEVAAAIREVAREHPAKTVVGVFMQAAGGPSALGSVPSYTFPETAAVALARVAAYGEWRQKPQGNVPAFDDIDTDDASCVVSSALERGDGWLTAEETARLLAAIHVPGAAARVVTTPAETIGAANALGYPVVLKALGPALLHKSEHHAVALSLENADAVGAAAAEFTLRFAGELTGFLVQQMVPGGVEMIVGAVQDPMFGPLVVCGSGGVLVDLLGDSAFRLQPLTVEDAGEMIGELKGARLLRGYRGAPPADEGALRDVLLRVSTLLTICPEIQELDLNPVKVLPKGCCVVDARVRVAREKPLPPARRVEY